VRPIRGGTEAEMSNGGRVTLADFWSTIQSISKAVDNLNATGELIIVEVTTEGGET
jgi:hypothetical protein